MRIFGDWMIKDETYPTKMEILLGYHYHGCDGCKMVQPPHLVYASSTNPVVTNGDKKVFGKTLCEPIS
jgi:hypothetical protein